LLERSSLGQKSLAFGVNQPPIVSRACHSVRDSNLPISKGNPARVESLKVPNISRQNWANFKSEWKKMSKSCQSVAIKIKNMPLEVLGTKDLKSGKEQHHKSQKIS